MRFSQHAEPKVAYPIRTTDELWKKTHRDCSARLVPGLSGYWTCPIDTAFTRTWRFAESGVRASYFGGGADWFSLVGGTIPFSRR
jgi:hypothetical protein